mgnify:CR=1 FL=1
MVLNHFYGSEVEVAIPEDYQTGRVLLSNYDDAELAEKVILKPYQTLASFSLSILQLRSFWVEVFFFLKNIFESA